MVNKQLEDKSVWIVGQAVRETEPVVVHRESGTQLNLFEAVVLILNRQEAILSKLEKRSA